MSSIADHAGAQMSCTGDIRCPGASGSATYTASNPCTFTRKLCVTCYESAGVVKVKVQSNGLPSHCFTSTVNNATAKEVEWETIWNADMKDIMNYPADDFDSSAKTDEILCDIQRTSSRNMHSSSDFSFVENGRRL